jgi:hypothetical protein
MSSDCVPAFQTQFDDGRLADVEKIVVLDEIRQNPGMDQQGRLAAQGVCRLQIQQLGAKVVQQCGGGSLFADPESHAVGAVDTLGKRTQVEADDGPFQPDTRRRDDFIDGNGQSSAAALSLFSSSSSILITRFIHSRANRCRKQFQPR